MWDADRRLPAVEGPETLRAVEGESRGGGLQTLVRGLAILDALAAAPAGRGVSHATLARQLGFQRSTLYRYLACLQAQGYVEPADGPRRFRLGSRARVLGLAALHEHDFARLARGFVDELAAAIGETAHATVFDQGQPVTVEIADGEGPIGPRISVGSRRPVHCSASGKVFLAHAPPREREAGLAGELERRTPATITDPAALRAHLADVRRLGYATDQAEFIPGVCCVAAPVFGHRGEVAGALSISVVAARLDPPALMRLTRPLLEAARRFSSRLGHDQRHDAELA
jgi:DNA-binding IclR family transcriptional regulator